MNAGPRPDPICEGYDKNIDAKSLGNEFAGPAGGSVGLQAESD